MNNVKKVFKEAASATVDMSKSISVRMTQFYLLLIIGWLIFNLGIGIVAHVDTTIVQYFIVLIVGLLAFMGIGYVFSVERYLNDFINVSILVMTPISWYVCGGTASSSVNSMFVMSIVYFCLCSYGKRRLIGTIVSITEVAGTTIITKRIPELAKPPYAPGPSVLTCNSSIGFATTMVIVFLLFKQIREYRREYERSEAYKDELRKSNELQKKFLANMSHEIRSPLGIVLGFNELIAKSNSIDEIREYSHNISAAGETLRVVINDILDLSKIESGKLEIIEGDYSLKKLIKDTEKNIRLKASEKGLKFDIEIGDDVPDMLFGDEVRIKQCLINILSNAVKYTDAGSVLLKITGVKSEDNPDMVNLSFLCRDTGRGIAPEASPVLFTAFERIDESRARGIEGTGLGLAITKALLDEMNGSVSVESVVGQGSDFTILLSQKISEKAAAKDAEAHEARFDGVCVAVVDDTKPNLILCKKLLELGGAVVETYNTGRAFLDACNEKKYDILLIDHMMPEMDGVEVLNTLKSSDGPNRDTPRFAFTANAMAGAEKEYMDYGFNGFISKPINRDEFASKILAALGR